MAANPPTPLIVRSLVTGLLAVCALSASGCSIQDSDGPASNDKREEAVTCLREKRLEARLLAGDGVQVGDPASGTRIKFFLTAGEAQAAQFKGRGEGAEQIGSALLFVRESSDAVLEDVESCLEEL